LLDARTESDLAAKNLAELEEGNRRGSIPDADVREADAHRRQQLASLDVARRKLVGLGVPASDVDRLRRGEGQPIRSLAVRSPLSGIVDHVDVAVGQVVEPGDHLLEVINSSRVWLRVAVLEKDLYRVRAGQQIVFQL